MKNMTSNEYDAIMISVNDVISSRLVSVVENCDSRAKVKTFGVNWGCCGTQNIEETNKFAEKLDKACRIVDKLNAMEIHVNYTDKRDKAEYLQKKDFYKNMFENI